MACCDLNILGHALPMLYRLTELDPKDTNAIVALGVTLLHLDSEADAEQAWPQGHSHRRFQSLGSSQSRSHDILDDLDVIECFEQPGHAATIGEITKKQKGLFESLGVGVPT
ncbi:MAG: hypothetical protein ACOYM2_01985 [Rectinemataceae bacterium]